MGLRRPKTDRLGVDFAGVVEAVGEGVTRFRPGDEVFGARTGAFAEYVCAREDRAVVPKPPNLTFEEAGSVATAAVTALQGLRDKGGLEPGQRVLINGASGGIGTFAVQIAKASGAEVTGVCSTPNVELVRSLGADHVVDYTREDFTLDRPSLRPDARHRREQVVVRVQAHPRAPRDARGRGSAEGRQAARAREPPGEECAWRRSAAAARSPSSSRS